jgi:hypothetical protein
VSASWSTALTSAAEAPTVLGWCLDHLHCPNNGRLSGRLRRRRCTHEALARRGGGGGGYRGGGGYPGGGAHFRGGAVHAGRYQAEVVLTCPARSQDTPSRGQRHVDIDPCREGGVANDTQRRILGVNADSAIAMVCGSPSGTPKLHPTQQELLRIWRVGGLARPEEDLKLTKIVLAAACVCGFLSMANAQSGGGGSGSSGASGASGSSGTAAGSMSSSGTVNGTGGSPGPNTSNALSHGTTGAKLGSPGASNSPASSSSSPLSYSNPRANSAVNALGNTDVGIIAPGRK